MITPLGTRRPTVELLFKMKNLLEIILTFRVCGLSTQRATSRFARDHMGLKLLFVWFDGGRVGVVAGWDDRMYRSLRRLCRSSDCTVPLIVV